MNREFDVMVLGLGAMGSAAIYQLAKRGKKVLGIDQFSPPHTQGSTHGDTRITRQGIGEGDEYVPLVLRSYEIWDEIEREIGRNILTVTGGLIMASVEDAIHHGSNFFKQTVASAKKYNIAHSLLDTEQIRRRFPQFKLKGTEVGYFEDMAGFLRPEECITAQLELAQKLGADLKVNEKVIGFTPSPTGDKVTVRTENGEYEAEKLVVTAGPWLPELLEQQYAQNLKIYRQILYWFDVEGDIRQFEPTNFPIWIWEFGKGQREAMYGFPAVDGPKGGIKVATEQFDRTTTPEGVLREVTPEEIQEMYDNYIRDYFNGVSNRLVKAVSCLYTVTPDFKFVIDFHPDYPQVIIGSPCSGHGFKHSAAIGEILAQLATDGKSSLDISKFNFKRFNNYG